MVRRTDAGTARRIAPAHGRYTALFAMWQRDALQ
jgi:hypothetical protein